MNRLSGLTCLVVILFWSVSPGLQAGLRKEVENHYLQTYKNKAMFLKIPVRGMRQMVTVTDQGPVLDRGNLNLPVSFKVGDQVRILDLDFRNDAVRFKVASVDLSRESEIEFRFASELTDAFPERAAFDACLASSFTEGISYAEVDTAKEDFIKGQFDHLIQQFASATSTSPDFVIKAISEKNPEYRRAKNEAAEAVKRMQTLEGTLAQESQARKQAEGELTQVRRELGQSRSSAQDIGQERDKLREQSEKLDQQVRRLTADNKDFEKRIREYDTQLNQLIRDLDLKTSSNQKLGDRVETLSTSISSLKNERAGLTQKLQQLSQQIETQQGENQKLAQELKVTQEARAKLQEEQRVLTSDRTSLNARYLETKNRKEVLETAAALSQALKLVDRLEEREEGLVQVSALYLGERQIGTLEVLVPVHPDRVYPVRFTLLSPDTVQFSEEERKLLKALGDKVQIETSWASGDANLQPMLVNGDPLRTAAQREPEQWTWIFKGEIPHKTPVELTTVLTDVNGEKIRLSSKQFNVSPGSMSARLLESFSPLSAAAGAVLGVMILGLAVMMRGRSAPGRSRRSPERKVPEPRPRESRDEQPNQVIQKRF